MPTAPAPRRDRQWLAAGVAGVAAITASSSVEMRPRGRAPSTVPARAAARVLRAPPADEWRFATVVHWAYGTAFGTVRGLIGAFGLRGPQAAALFFASAWGAELVALPALDIGVRPAWRWGAAEIGVDAFHHGVYAAAASVACEYLDR